MIRLAPLMMLAAAAGCTCGGAGNEIGADAGYPACPDGTVYDPDAGSCAAALPVAAACGALPDGGAAEGLCAAGLSCVSTGRGGLRCARDCSPKVGCAEGRTCFAQVGAPHGALGFCASQARVGEPCDAAALVFCSGDNLTCISPAVDQTAGRCFKYCDPRVPDPNPECAGSQSCADLFPEDPACGICVEPAGTYPNPCNHSLLAFCGRAQVCVRPSALPHGYCHSRCARDGDCAPGERCLAPAPEISFCAAPVARCAPGGAACPSCAGEEDRYCAPEDLCVLLGQARVCKADCSKGEVCPAETHCTPVSSSASSICL